MKKLFLVILATLLVASSAYAMNIPQMANVKAANNTTDNGRDHIDIEVRVFWNDPLAIGQVGALGGRAGSGYIGQVATKGSVVIWATQDGAVIGRDVTYGKLADSNLIAGFVSENGGIASGAYGTIRVYGYMTDVLIADSTDAVTANAGIGTASILQQTPALLGQAGGGSGGGVALEAGSGADGDAIQVLINIDNSAF